MCFKILLLLSLCFSSIWEIVVTETTEGNDELSITPILDIKPENQVFEGDELTVFCGYTRVYDRFIRVELSLRQGTMTLQTSPSNFTRNVLPFRSAEFECRLETGKSGEVVKTAKKTVIVSELFSRPTLTMSPEEVFPKDDMTLICKSEKSDRLSSVDLTYAIEPQPLDLKEDSPGVFSGKAPSVDFDYTCSVRAKGILKQSNVLTVRPKGVNHHYLLLLLIPAGLLGAVALFVCIRCAKTKSKNAQKNRNSGPNPDPTPEDATHQSLCPETMDKMSEELHLAKTKS